MDKKRLADVYAYTLAVAGERDGWPIALTAIHLLKYAYLADLDFARSPRGGGSSYTGTSWTFFDFGPWSAEAFGAIQPIAADIGAEPKPIGNSVGWTLPVEDAEKEPYAKALPATVALAIKRFVKQFGASTPELLHYVYDTAPMRAAAPGDALNLSLPEHEAHVHPDGHVLPEPAVAVTPSVKAQRRRADSLAAARARIQELQRAKKRAPGPANPPPRYDDVFEAGAAWLDSLAGEPIPATSGILQIAQDVWTTPRGGKLPE